MTRHHNLLVAAVLSVAVGGCALLVQFGESEGQTAGGYQSITDLSGFSNPGSPTP